MITKILFTLAIIIGAFLYIRHKGSRPSNNNPAQQKKPAPSEGEKMFRQGAYLFLLFMVLSAVVLMYSNFTEQNKTIQVHVVNTQTGEQKTYHAEQKEIKGKHFTTIEGRKIFIANIERLEIEPLN